MKKHIAIVLIILLLLSLGVDLTGYADSSMEKQKAVFMFPSALREIHTEALDGTAAHTVILPVGFSRIEDNAFRHMLFLHDVYIPPTVTYISNLAFPPYEKIVLHGEAGSWIQRWAEEYHYIFVAENRWKGINQKFEVGSRLIDTFFLHDTIQPDDSNDRALTGEFTDRSMRPQDRPELNPIDYNFP